MFCVYLSPKLRTFVSIKTKSRLFSSWHLFRPLTHEEKELLDIWRSRLLLILRPSSSCWTTSLLFWWERDSKLPNGRPLIINPFTASKPALKRSGWGLRNQNPEHDLCSQPAARLVLLAVYAGSCRTEPWATACADTKASIYSAPFTHTCLSSPPAFIMSTHKPLYFCELHSAQVSISFWHHWGAMDAAAAATDYWFPVDLWSSSSFPLETTLDKQIPSCFSVFFLSFLD